MGIGAEPNGLQARLGKADRVFVPEEFDPVGIKKNEADVFMGIDGAPKSGPGKSGKKGVGREVVDGRLQSQIQRSFHRTVSKKAEKIHSHPQQHYRAGTPEQPFR